jgi:transcriptional regulator with GAF, ATPase, and Fis domain
MWIHVFYRGDYQGSRQIEAGHPPVVVGRSPDRDLVLDRDEMVSSRHLELAIEENRIRVTDLGSKNGTFIDGRKIENAELPPGKSVCLGNSRLLLSAHPSREIRKTVFMEEPLSGEIEGRESSSEALERVYRIFRKVSAVSERGELLETLFEELSGELDPDRILYLEPGGAGERQWILRAKREKIPSRGMPDYSRSIPAEAESRNEAVFIQNIMERNFASRESMNRIGLSSVIAVPLVAGKRAFGVIEVENLHQDRCFTERDFFLVCLLGQMLGGIIRDLGRIENYRRENAFYREQLEDDLEIIGVARKTKEMRSLILRVAGTETTVLVTGESGTGKELVARAIHFNSPRKQRPFIVINCASLPEHLVESELFGHEKGAFTGAREKRIGKLEAADGGTVFLDEIGDMPVNLQTRLLRFLELGEIHPLGSNRIRRADVRVIAATNRDLETAIRERAFRRDLYYRLSVFRIHCPPLRERRKDIPILSAYYLEKLSRDMGKRFAGIESEALSMLERYAWPGNIRELKNVMERACVIERGEWVGVRTLPRHLSDAPGDAAPEGPLPEETDPSTSGRLPPLWEIEKRYILSVFRKMSGNKARTAKALGITRKTLYSKLKEYDDLV